MRALLVIAMFVGTQVVPAPQAPNGSTSRTQVVLLGTGSPPADPLSGTTTLSLPQGSSRPQISESVVPGVPAR